MKNNRDSRKAAIYNLINSNKLEEAKELCKQYISNSVFLSIYVKLLMRTECDEEVEQLCLDNLNDPIICSQYLYHLIGKNRFEEARSICERYQHVKTLKAQYIRILNHFKEYDLIDDIASEYPDDLYINKAYIYSLIDQEKYNKARSLCDRFIEDDDIKKIRLSIEGRYDPISPLEASRKYFKILEKINKGKYKAAKQMCEGFIDNPCIFNLYIYLIEKNRIKEGKKLLYRDK